MLQLRLSLRVYNVILFTVRIRRRRSLVGSDVLHDLLLQHLVCVVDGGDPALRCIGEVTTVALSPAELGMDAAWPGHTLDIVNDEALDVVGSSREWRIRDEANGGEWW